MPGPLASPYASALTTWARLQAGHRCLCSSRLAYRWGPHVIPNRPPAPAGIVARGCSNLGTASPRVRDLDRGIRITRRTPFLSRISLPTSSTMPPRAARRRYSRRRKLFSPKPSRAWDRVKNRCRASRKPLVEFSGGFGDRFSRNRSPVWRERRWGRHSWWRAPYRRSIYWYGLQIVFICFQLGVTPVRRHDRALWRQIAFLRREGAVMSGGAAVAGGGIGGNATAVRWDLCGGD
jgi:hypothetical protein